MADENNFFLLSANVSSLEIMDKSNKVANCYGIRELLRRTSADCFAIQETFLKENTDKTQDAIQYNLEIKKKLKIHGYDVLREDRTGVSKAQGGVAIYIKSSYNAHKIKDLGFTGAEVDILVISFNVGQREMFIVNCHRKKKLNEDNFLSYLTATLNSIQSRKADDTKLKTVIVCGDTNIDWMKKAKKVSLNTSICNEFQLRQIVEYPTHHKTLIDQIFVPTNLDWSEVVMIPTIENATASTVSRRHMCVGVRIDLRSTKVSSSEAVHEESVFYESSEWQSKDHRGSVIPAARLLVRGALAEKWPQSESQTLLEVVKTLVRLKENEEVEKSETSTSEMIDTTDVDNQPGTSATAATELAAAKACSAAAVCAICGETGDLGLECVFCKMPMHVKCRSDYRYTAFLQLPFVFVSCESCCETRKSVKQPNVVSLDNRMASMEKKFDKLLSALQPLIGAACGSNKSDLPCAPAVNILTTRMSAHFGENVATDPED